MRYRHIETFEVATHREWQNKLKCSFRPDNPPPVLTLVTPTPHQPVPVDIAALKATALHIVNDYYQRIAEQQIGQYPDFEIQTWQDQEREALAYHDWLLTGSTGPAPLTPTLIRIINERGIDLPDLVTRVINNAASWRQIAPQLAGQRQAAADLIDDAKTADEVNAVIDQHTA